MVGYGSGRYQHDVADFDAVGFYYHMMLIEIVRCLPRVVRHVESRKWSIWSLVDFIRTDLHSCAGQWRVWVSDSLSEESANYRTFSNPQIFCWSLVTCRTAASIFGMLCITMSKICIVRSRWGSEEIAEDVVGYLDDYVIPSLFSDSAMLVEKGWTFKSTIDSVRFLRLLRWRRDMGTQCWGALRFTVRHYVDFQIEWDQMHQFAGLYDA